MAVRATQFGKKNKMPKRKPDKLKRFVYTIGASRVYETKKETKQDDKDTKISGQSSVPRDKS